MHPEASLLGCPKLEGVQAEYAMVPLAETTLFKAPEGVPDTHLILMAGECERASVSERERDSVSETERQRMGRVERERQGPRETVGKAGLSILVPEPGGRGTSPFPLADFGRVQTAGARPSRPGEQLQPSQLGFFRLAERVDWARLVWASGASSA